MCKEVRILTALLAIALLSACGSSTPGSGTSPVGAPTPSATAPPEAPTGAGQAVYFTVAAGADPARIAATAMGRGVYIERAPGPGANPGDGTPEPTAFLMPVAPGGESDALARFKAAKDVVSASLGRYPPFIPS